MKNLLLLFFVLLFSVNSYCQNELDENQIVKKALYTDAERTKFRTLFKNDLAKIELSTEKRATFDLLIKDHFDKLITVNKSRSLTKKQMTEYVKNNIIKMNKEVKKLLSISQYNEYKKIINRRQSSILDRIEKQ